MELIKNVQILGALILIVVGSIGYMVSKGYKDVGQVDKSKRMLKASIICFLGGVAWAIGAYLL